jgi:hypothetical protein
MFEGKTCSLERSFTSFLRSGKQTTSLLHFYLLCQVPDCMVLPHLACSAMPQVEGLVSVITQNCLART